MRLLDQHAPGVPRKLEPCHVRAELLRRSRSVGGSTKQRAAPRASRAARFPEELFAVRGELVAVDPVVHLALRGRTVQGDRPQLDLEVALLRRLRQVEQAIPLRGEAPGPLCDLAGRLPRRGLLQRSGAGASVVAGQEEKLAAWREAELVDAL